jgi:hypothetical protein
MSEQESALPVDDAKAAEAAPARLAPQQALDGWDRLTRQTAIVLRGEAPDAAWVTQFEALLAEQRELARRDPDAALYLLVHMGANEIDRYSAHHAMLCSVAAELCAQALGWPAEERDALARAALTMNLSMSAAQDAMTRQAEPLSQTQRDAVSGHGERSAQLLAAAGVADALWLEVVRLHHDDTARLDGGASPAQRLASLLHRVDLYTAKLSRRASRKPLLPTLAARQTCFDESNHLDAPGSAILRALGLYPPGSFVRLANGEVGIVVRRGAKAHAPLVAALRRSDGGLYLQPMRRDTMLSRHAVVQGISGTDVKVHINHTRVIAAA